MPHRELQREITGRNGGESALRAARARLAEGLSHIAGGRRAQAVASFREAARLRPDLAEAHNNLGLALLESGQPAEAEGSLRAAIACRPDFSLAWCNLGDALSAQRRRAEAMTAYRRALAVEPGLVAASCNLGVACEAEGNLAAAEEAYRSALASDPRHATSLYNLGGVLLRRRRFDDAIAVYQEALRGNPRHARALHNLATAFKETRRTAAALAAAELALEAQPDFPEALVTAGAASVAARRFDHARPLLERAVGQPKPLAEAYAARAELAAEEGDPDRAVADYRLACGIKPDLLEARTALIFHLPYGERQPALTEVLAEGKAWESAGRPAVAPTRHPPAGDPDRTLRVGYLSPDFRDHAAAYFLEPLIANHDPRHCDVTCYSEAGGRLDAVGRRIREAAPAWCDTAGLTDDELAARIRQDRIDILIDCAGHTRRNRLAVFLRRPAPVQMSHIVGQGGSTGLSVMDYLIADSRLVPVDGPAIPETPLRLPRVFAPFRPRPDWPAPSPLPAGPPVLAYFGDPSRVGAPLVAAWREILERCPGSRLLLKHGVLDPAGATDAYRRRFAPLGDRCDFEGIGGGWARHMEVYERITLVLDSHPVSGATTTLIPLWQGVPVVALAGPDSWSRFGAAILGALGLDDLVATSPEAYADIACRLLADRARLEHLRATLRTTVECSPFRDEAGATRDLETALRGAWRDWCRQAVPAGP